MHSSSTVHNADTDTYRVRAGKRETGYIGQASWLSSVVNLLNTSECAIRLHPWCI